MARVVIGDELGFIKVVSVDRKQVLQRAGEANRAEGVTRLAWVKSTPSSDGLLETGFVSSHQNGRVQVWSPEATPVHSWTDPTGSITSNTVLVTHPSWYDAAGGFLVVSPTGLGARSPLTAQDAGSIQKFRVGGPVACGALLSADKLVVGGEERELEVYDLSKLGAATSAEPLPSLWRAKNVPPDRIQLRVPVAVRAVAPRPGEEYTVAIATGYGQWRLYDTRSQRRPTRDVAASGDDEFALTDIAWCGGEEETTPNLLMTTDVRGGAKLWDIRVGGKAPKPVRQLKGATGGLRAVAAHGSLPLVATVGLDRWVHVHDRGTGVEAARVYTKQRMTAVLFSERLTEEAAAKKDEAREHDEIWDRLQTVGGDADDDNDSGSDDEDAESGDDSESDDESDAAEEEEEPRPAKRRRRG